MHRRSVFSLVSGLAMIAVAAGCVPQQKYDDLATSYKTLQEELVRAEAEIDAKNNANRMLQERLSASSAQLSKLESDNQRLHSELQKMGIDYDALLARINSINFEPLPSDVNTALQQLAAQYPGLLTFDSRLGMVRFASDLTFALGSADLQSSAVQSLQALAGILNSPSLATYEVKVVGHTDNVRIAQPQTLAKHPTNTHLSVHRAISVADALIGSSVDPRRIQVAGYGPYRPVVQNGPRGAAENRRVEIFIVPLTANLAELPPAQPEVVNPALARPQEPMK